MAQIKEELLKTLLLQIAKEQNFVNYDLKIEPISSGGANYSSILYNITFSKGNRVVHMFAKVAAVGEEMRAQAPEMFETEMYYYTNLLEVYERLYEEHNVLQEHRLISPKYYGSNRTTYEETLVLENLVMNGYQSFDRTKSVDWEYAKSAITELAKFHSLSLGYSEYFPKEYSKALSKLKGATEMLSELLMQIKPMTIDKTLSNVREENKEPLQKVLNAFTKDKFIEFYK